MEDTTNYYLTLITHLLRLHVLELTIRGKADAQLGARFTNTLQTH